MARFVDPLGLIAGTWNWMSVHGGGGFAAFVAVIVVLVLHLVVLAGIACLVVNPGRIIDAVRGFVQGVQDNGGDRTRR